MPAALHVGRDEIVRREGASARLRRYPRTIELASPLSTGELIADKYRVEGILGEGGMGIVYAARHEILGQRVALKVLRPDYASHEEVNARFLQEARTAARIESEHVARTLDVGKLTSGLPYIVIELLEGKDLGAVLSEGGPLAIADAVDYVLQALEAVAEAHSIGMVHRDLKPSNLFLARRRDGSVTVKVLDFGISKATVDDEDDAVRLTSTRQILGTPAYISPEQLRQSRDVDARADVWAIGVVLYELLSGALPFNGAGVGSMFAAILEQTPMTLREHRPEVPALLDAAVMKCLERSRAARWQNVADLAQALGRFGSRSSAVSSERILRVLPIIDVKVDDDPLSARSAAAAAAAAAAKAAADDVASNRTLAPATVQDPPRTTGANETAPPEHKATMRMAGTGSDPAINAGTDPSLRRAPAAPILSTAASWTASSAPPRRKLPLLAVFVTLGAVGLLLVLVSVITGKTGTPPITQGNPVPTATGLPTTETTGASASGAKAVEPAASTGGVVGLVTAELDAGAAGVTPTSTAGMAAVPASAPTTIRRPPNIRPITSVAVPATASAPAVKPSAAPSSRPNTGILDRN